MTKKIILLFVIAVIGWLLWVGGFPLPYLINNYRLNSFASQLEGIPLPVQTKRIGHAIKKFGNLGTCSKHGDYYAEFKVVSSLSYSQLKAYYSRYKIQVPEINNVLFSSFRGLGTHGLRTIDVEKNDGIANTYLVSAFDPGYWHNDFRCW